MKIAVVKELVESADDAVKAKVAAYVDSLKALGATVEAISLAIVKQAQTAWQILMSAETTNHLSRFDGVK